jgi:hypothetical protein
MFFSGEVILWKFNHLVIRAQVICLYYIGFATNYIFVDMLRSIVMASMREFKKTCPNVSS